MHFRVGWEEEEAFVPKPIAHQRAPGVRAEFSPWPAINPRLSLGFTNLSLFGSAQSALIGAE
jgi:hypothetical protein